MCLIKHGLAQATADERGVNLGDCTETTHFVTEQCQWSVVPKFAWCVGCFVVLVPCYRSVFCIGHVLRQVVVGTVRCAGQACVFV